LYSLDLNGGQDVERAIAYFWRGFADVAESQEGAASAQKEREANVIAFAEELIRGTVLHMPEIDAMVQRASKNWRLERMARVDRNLLRLATYELRFVTGIPTKVVINEAIELAKYFGAAESPAFVNGLLDRISQEQESPPP
jgi:N utilization substance protein B